jgi:type IV pilus assembly protein PilO
MTVTTEKRTLPVAQWMEKIRALLTLLNLHIAGVALLGLVNLYLLAHMFFAWREASNQDEAALMNQAVVMKAAEIAKKPLEGLDEKLVDATKDADRFYQKRLPFADSQMLAELGALTKKQGVRLTRVQYADPVPMLTGTAGAVTDVRMDASLSGDYRPLVLFINSLERDKMFFMIHGLTLTGQQSGTVGLRLNLTTYLRKPLGTESLEKDVVGSDAAAASSAGNVRSEGVAGTTPAKVVNGGRTR